MLSKGLNGSLWLKSKGSKGKAKSYSYYEHEKVVVVKLYCCSVHFRDSGVLMSYHHC